MVSASQWRARIPNQVQSVSSSVLSGVREGYVQDSGLCSRDLRFSFVEEVQMMKSLLSNNVSKSTMEKPLQDYMSSRQLRNPDKFRIGDY